MNYGEQVKRIRRFLRDPDGKIWESGYLKTAFNNVQNDLQNQTRILEDIITLRIPPFYQFSYMFDWEWRYLPSDQSNFHQCLRFHQQAHYTFCNRWEMQIEQGAEGIAIEPGTHFTQPWESWLTTPGEVIPIKFPYNFHSVKVMSYDFEPLPYIDKKEITSFDSSYIERVSEPIGYYREDDFSNEFIIYPRPSTTVWNDVIEQSDPAFIYTFSFESIGYIEGTGETFVRSNSYQYVFTWEETIDNTDDVTFRGMFLFERGFQIAGQAGMVLYVEGDTTEGPLGTFESRTGSVFNQDLGIAVDVIDAADNVLLIYDIDPADIQDELEESDFPAQLQKYIEYGVLDRAYGANTDGRIKSLREYWAFRYEMGIQVVKRYMSMRKQDRNYRFVTSTLPSRRTVRRARLPDSYPAIG